MIHVPHALRVLLAGRELRAGAQAPAAPPRADAAPTLADDGGHAAQYATHSHRFWYVEWWYFTFTDAASGLAGIVAVGVFNPTNELGLGSASTTAVVYTPDGVFTAMDPWPLDTYAASADRADVKAGPNQITVVDPRAYQVKARSKDGSMTFDLTFRAADDARWLGHRMPGERPWEVSSWMSWMPAARVSGTVTVAGRAPVALADAPGYHDHNWAVWLFPCCVWTWVSAVDPEARVNLDFADQPSFSYRALYLRVGDERIAFDRGMDFSLADWARWMLLWKRPTAGTASGVDRTGAWRAELSWRALQLAALWRAPMLVFEHTAEVTVSLSRRDGERWEPAGSWVLRGFYEYTAEWL